MTYRQQPGTIAFRAIAHLESLGPGVEIMGGKLAEAIGAQPSSLQTCMESAVAAGIVRRRRRDSHATSPLWWSLAEHGKDSRTVDLESAADGSQKPSGGAQWRPAKAGSDLPEDGIGRAGVTARATNREGASDAVALATQCEASAAREAGEAATESAQVAGQELSGGHAEERPAAETGSTRFALWSDGELHIQRPARSGFVLSADETRALVAYLDAISLESVRGGA